MKAEKTGILRFFKTRRAEWVWIRKKNPRSFFPDPDQVPRETPNRYLYLRHTFHISTTVARARAYVSADGRYQFFVNGAFIGRGPVRGSPDYQPVDDFDLTGYLKKGLNAYAVLVHAYGRNMSWYELPRPFQRRHFGSGGFFLQSDITTEEGDFSIDTDGNWKCMEAPAWRRDVPGGSRGFVEIYDAATAPSGWQEPAYNDTSWSRVEVLRRPGENNSPDMVPFPVMIERMIPLLEESIVAGIRISSHREVLLPDEDGPLPDLFDNMVDTEKKKCRIEDPEFCLTDDQRMRVSTVKGRGILLVVDFGRVVAGRPRFHIRSEKEGALVDFTCGEYLDRTGRVIVNAGIPGVNVPQIHRYRVCAGDQAFERFEWEGFRYLELLIHRAETPLELSGVGVRCSSYPVTKQGYFNSSDTLLNRIWRVGANTLEACRQDSFMDCPTREQRQWMGDAYVEMMINWAVFGDPLLPGQLLYHIAWSQKPDGRTAMAAPGDFSREDLLHIPDYSLYWILALERYHFYTGDKNIVADLFPAAERLIAWFERFIDDDGLLTGLPGWTFIDWAEIDKKGASTAVNAQYAGALQAMAAMAPLAGCDEKSGRFQSLAGRTRDAVNRLLWDASRGVYIDGIEKGIQSRRVSQQSNAAVIAFGAAPPERRALALDYILREDRWVVSRSVTGPSVSLDEENQVVRIQPFFGHHLHRAMYLDGRIESLVHHIRRYWGGLAETGETFPELWHQTPVSTTCHAWSASPTFDLSTYVLGIMPLEPGFKRFLVMPNPVHLAYCQGLFPALSGDISVEWFFKNRNFQLTLQVPDACEADLMLPPWVTSDMRVEYNGRILNAEEGSRIFKGFKTGSHSFIVKDVPAPDMQDAPAPVVVRTPEIDVPEIQIPDEPDILNLFTSRFRGAGGEEAFTVGLVISGRAWTLTIHEGRLRVRKGLHQAGLILSTAASTLYAILTGKLEGSDAVASGRLRFRGDLSLLPGFLDLFGF